MGRTLRCCVGALALTAILTACGDTDDEATTTTTGEGGGGPDLTVDALDSLDFDQDSYEVEAGEVEVLYVNEGNLPHTLLVDEVDDFKLSVGDEDSGTVTLEPGTYTLYCDVAGHRAGGMEAELTVT